MKKIFFCFLFLSLQVFSQNIGYTISVKTKNLKGEIIYLSFYNANYKKNIAIDSAKIDLDTQNIVFSQTKQKIIPAIYQIKIGRQSNEKRDFFLDNGKKLEFSVSQKDLSDFSTKDALNKDFLGVQSAGSNQQKLALLESMKKKFPDNGVLNLFYTMEKRRLDKDFVLGLSADKKREDFLKGIDMYDKRTVLLPNLHMFLYSYVNLYPVNKENYAKNVDLLLKGKDCDQKNYIIYLDWFLKNLVYFETNKDFSEMYKYVFDKYVNTAKCVEKIPKIYNYAFTKLKSIETLKIGSVLPDFDIMTKDGAIEKITQEIANKPFTYIVFYDPDCSHCKEEMPKIVAFFDSISKQNQDKVNKIAFLNVEDQSKWEDFIKKNKLENWKNVRNGNKNFDIALKLGVFGNPNFLLIDQKGTVLSKNFNEQEINNILEKGQ